MRLLTAILLLTALLLPSTIALPNFTIYGSADGLTGDSIGAIAANERIVWVNGWYPTSVGATGGLSTYSYSDDRWITYTEEMGLAAPVLQGLEIDSEGDVWICHAGGVQIFDPEAEEFVKNYGPEDGLQGAIQDLKFQGEDLAWAASIAGLGRLDRGTGQWIMYGTEDGLVNDKVYSIAVDEGTLWIATAGGLSKYEVEDGQWTSYTTSDGIADDIVNKVVVAGGSVWLATRSGLNRLSKSSGKIVTFGKADGLPSNNILDVAVFRDRVWVATSDGVGKKEGGWSVVDESDGLPVTNVKLIATQKDYIWFATPKGVARYGPIGPGLSFTSPYFYVIVLAVAGAVVLFVARPGARRKAADEARPRRAKKDVGTRKPPYEICGGLPKRRLCNRCKYYTLKSGSIRCGKYNMPIEFADEGEGRLRQLGSAVAPDKGEELPQNDEEDTEG